MPFCGRGVLHALFQNLHACSLVCFFCKGCAACAGFVRILGWAGGPCLGMVDGNPVPLAAAVLQMLVVMP